MIFKALEKHSIAIEMDLRSELQIVMFAEVMWLLLFNLVEMKSWSVQVDLISLLR